MQSALSSLPHSALVVGASGGLGRALVHELLHVFPTIQVIATQYSSPIPFTHPRVKWERVDVRNADEIAQLAKQTSQLDWLINCVGFLHSEKSGPEKTIRAFNTEFLMHNIQVNTLPTLLLAQYFSPLLKSSDAPLLASLSARVGSIDENYLGGWYSYRLSKAALNMALKTLSVEWQRTHPKGCVASLHPGTNDTSLSKPFQAGVPVGQLLNPSDTARKLINLLSSLGAQDSGQFWTWEGDKLPW